MNVRWLGNLVVAALAVAGLFGSARAASADPGIQARGILQSAACAHWLYPSGDTIHVCGNRYVAAVAGASSTDPVPGETRINTATLTVQHTCYPAGCGGGTTTYVLAPQDVTIDPAGMVGVVNANVVGCLVTMTMEANPVYGYESPGAAIGVIGGGPVLGTYHFAEGQKSSSCPGVPAQKPSQYTLQTYDELIGLVDPA